jgi:hypothetical protein
MPGTRVCEDSLVEASDVLLENHIGTNIASPFTPNGLVWSIIDGANRGVVIGVAAAARSTNTGGHYLNSGTPATADYYVDDTLVIHDFSHGYMTPALRVSGINTATVTGYFVTMSTGGTFELWRYVNNVQTALQIWTPSPALTAPCNLPVRLMAVGNVITFFADTGAGLVARITYVDASPIVAKGAPGVKCAGNGTGDALGCQSSQYIVTNYVTTTIAANPIGMAPSSSSSVVTFNGVGTSWLTTAPILSISGGTGASISSPTVVNNTTCTALVTPGTTLGTLTVTESTNSQFCPIYVVSVLATDPNIVWSPYSTVNQNGVQVFVTLGGYGKIP